MKRLTEKISPMLPFKEGGHGKDIYFINIKTYCVPAEYFLHSGV